MRTGGTCPFFVAFLGVLIAYVVTSKIPVAVTAGSVVPVIVPRCHIDSNRFKAKATSRGEWIGIAYDIQYEKGLCDTDDVYGIMTAIINGVNETVRSKEGNLLFKNVAAVRFKLESNYKGKQYFSSELCWSSVNCTSLCTSQLLGVVATCALDDVVVPLLVTIFWVVPSAICALALYLCYARLQVRKRQDLLRLREAHRREEALPPAIVVRQKGTNSNTTRVFIENKTTVPSEDEMQVSIEITSKRLDEFRSTNKDDDNPLVEMATHREKYDTSITHVHVNNVLERNNKNRYIRIAPKPVEIDENETLSYRAIEEDSCRGTEAIARRPANEAARLDQERAEQTARAELEKSEALSYRAIEEDSYRGTEAIARRPANEAARLDQELVEQAARTELEKGELAELFCVKDALMQSAKIIARRLADEAAYVDLGKLEEADRSLAEESEDTERRHFEDAALQNSRNVARLYTESVAKESLERVEKADRSRINDTEAQERREATLAGQFAFDVAARYEFRSLVAVEAMQREQIESEEKLALLGMRTDESLEWRDALNRRYSRKILQLVEDEEVDRGVIMGSEEQSYDDESAQFEEMGLLAKKSEERTDGENRMLSASQSYGAEYKWRMLRMSRLPSVPTPPKPFIGFSLAEYRDEGYLQVEGLYENGPAYQVGIRIGDVLLSIEGEPVRRLQDARLAVDKHCRAAELADLTLRRPDGTVYEPTLWIMTAEPQYKNEPFFFDIHNHMKHQRRRSSGKSAGLERTPEKKNLERDADESTEK